MGFLYYGLGWLFIFHGGKYFKEKRNDFHCGVIRRGVLGDLLGSFVYFVEIRHWQFLYTRCPETTSLFIYFYWEKYFQKFLRIFYLINRNVGCISWT